MLCGVLYTGPSSLVFPLEGIPGLFDWLRLQTNTRGIQCGWVESMKSGGSYRRLPTV